MENYKILRDLMFVHTPPFSKEKFFGSEAGVKIVMGDKFKSLILPELRPDISAGNITVTCRDLIKSVTDVDNLTATLAGELFTPEDWAQVLYFNLLIDRGFFKTDSMNISYVELKNTAAFAAYALLEPDGLTWRLGANPVDSKLRESRGRRLLSRFSRFL